MIKMEKIVKMLKQSKTQVGVLGPKIYVCGGTDDSWTAHATVEVTIALFYVNDDDQTSSQSS